MSGSEYGASLPIGHGRSRLRLQHHPSGAGQPGQLCHSSGAERPSWLLIISGIIISNRRAATTCQRLWTSSRGRGASPATSWSGSRSRSARQCGLVGPLPRVRRRPPQRPSAPTITGVAGSAQPMPVISCLQPARSPSARTFRRRLTRMKKWAHQVNEHEETLEGYCGAR